MGIFKKKDGLKVLFVVTEEAPFAKVGGLGEVMFSLPRALAALGCDARVMIPRYGTIDPRTHGLVMEYEGLEVPTGSASGLAHLRCNVLRYDPKNHGSRSPVTTYFLENQEYYELRSNIYGYKDDRLRFALLSRGALEFLNLSREWMPDVIVSADWMTGFIPNFLKHNYAGYRRLKDLVSVFSIHNLASHGASTDPRFVPEAEKDDGSGPVPELFSERLELLNFLKRGILYADAVNTVSPTYAQEIMLPEFGEGMDALLRERRAKLFGIINGIDYETRNPETDSMLEARFNSNSFEKRVKNKFALQERFGFSKSEDAFVLGIVSRLWPQKGFALLEPIIEQFLKSSGSQLFVVGTGEVPLMEFFQRLSKKFPSQVGAHLQYDDVLPHLVFGGADVILVPSQFEPCGLTQMEALRYGAIPIVRRVGGLADTVKDYSPGAGEGTGFVFSEFEPMAFLVALVRAHTSWQHKDAWHAMQKRAMEEDFSWERSAREYIELFRKAIEFRRRETDAKEEQGS